MSGRPRSEKEVQIPRNESSLRPTAARASHKWRTRIAWSFTGVGGLAWVLGLVRKSGDLPAMSLNEWGDFVAGAAAPLALLWLVIGYYQHGEELKLNTMALEAQQRELHQQVKETKQLVETARRDLEYRQEIDAKKISPRFEYERTNKYSDGLGIIIKNVGAEVFNVRIIYHGYHEAHTPTKDSMERNDEMELTLTSKGDAPIFPIKLSIAYVDEHGNEHEYGYDISDEGDAMRQVTKLKRRSRL